MQDLKLSIFKNLKSYDSKPVGLQEILWWIQHDESVRNKTELYRKMAYGLSRDEANKKGIKFFCSYSFFYKWY